MRSPPRPGARLIWFAAGIALALTGCTASQPDTRGTSGGADDAAQPTASGGGGSQDQGDDRLQTGPAACDLDAIVGATWVPVPVVCPHDPDEEALTACAESGAEALYLGQPYATVGEALAASQPGDTVVVCPGEYHDAWSLSERVLVAADPTPEATVVSPHPDAPHEEAFLTSNDATIRGFTMRAGRSFQADEGHDITAECISGRRGGQYLIESSIGPREGTITVRHSTFYESRGIAAIQSGNVIIEDCEFINAGSQDAYAVSATYDATVRRTVFKGFVGDGYGLDGRALLGRDSVTCEQCWFEGNATSDSKGVAIYTKGTATIRDSTFLNNQIESGHSEGTLGAKGAIDIADTTFIGNSQDVGSVLDLHEATAVHRIVRTVFIGNSAGNTSAIDLGSNAQLYARELRVWSNHSTSEGGSAASVGRNASFACDCCDFGVDGSEFDNEPADLELGGVSETRRIEISDESFSYLVDF